MISLDQSDGSTIQLTISASIQAPCLFPFKVEWLQQQVVRRRAKRNSRASHIYSIDTKPEHLQSNQTLHYNNLWYIVSLKHRQTEPRIDPDLFLYLFLLRAKFNVPLFSSTALQRRVQRLPVWYEHSRGLEERLYREGCGGVCPR